MKQNYTINFETKEITITKEFGKKASQLKTPEARLMKELRETYLDFTFTYRKIAVKENKESYAGLTLDVMGIFFDSRIRVAKAENPEEKEKLSVEIDREAFLKVKELTKGTKGRYATIKKWFLKNFGEEYLKWSKTDEFDIKKKKNEEDEKEPVEEMNIEEMSIEELVGKAS